MRAQPVGPFGCEAHVPGRQGRTNQGNSEEGTKQHRDYQQEPPDAQSAPASAISPPPGGCALTPHDHKARRSCATKGPEVPTPANGGASPPTSPRCKTGAGQPRGRRTPHNRGAPTTFPM